MGQALAGVVGTFRERDERLSVVSMGAKAVLSALACSITHGYAPEMHVDTPMDGTLECIVSSSPVYCSRARNRVKMLQTLALGSRRPALRGRPQLLPVAHEDACARELCHKTPRNSSVRARQLRRLAKQASSMLATFISSKCKPGHCATLPRALGRFGECRISRIERSSSCSVHRAGQHFGRLPARLPSPFRRAVPQQGSRG